MSAMAKRTARTARLDERARAPVTYRQAGVDIEAGDEMVEGIRQLVAKTYSPRVVGPFGGFAGLFSLDFRERLLRRNYRDPLLVACCDGVGSKLKLAFATGKLDTVGIDLVAMNVNDLICTGAEPLFFLDYLAVGKLEPKRMRQIIAGISAGCVEAGCALLGGETAEMPEFYKPDEFDMAGFAVGVVERGRVTDGSRVQAGDAVIALASSGLHSNGYALARKVLFQRGHFKLTDSPPELEGATLADALLTPTRIYVRPVMELLGAYKRRHVVKALAHITGSGLPGNLPRVLPQGLTARLKRASWQVPGVFNLIARTGPVDQVEMFRVFNMGVGFALVVAAAYAGPVMSRLRRAGERCWLLGKIVPGGPALQWA
jgi:phosphoribosylformylglycinamidine cyclo-ligase